MKKYALITCLLLAGYCQSMAQNFQSYIGSKERSEVALDVKGLKDGGSVIVGYTTELKKGDKYNYSTTDMIIMRVDASGNIIWNRRYGIPDVDDKLIKVIVSQSGEFIAVGHAGLVPYMYPYTGNTSAAAIFRFDPSNGNINNQAFLRSNDGYDVTRGEVYRDVTELEDGQLCAVGTRDFQPAFADGMVTMYDPSLNVQWHRNIELFQSNEVNCVVSEGMRIWIGGIYYSNTYSDLHIAEFDASGGLVWSHRYDYTLSRDGVQANSQWMWEMEVVKEELRVLAHASEGWGNPPILSAIMSVDKNNGNPNWLHSFNDPAYPYANTIAMNHENSNSAYYIMNPANIPLSQEYPSWLSGDQADAIPSIVDPPAPSFVDARRLIHNGTQALNAVHLFNSDRFYAGSSIGDPQQIGAYDIYYINSQNGLPEPGEGCKIENPKVIVDKAEIDHKEFELKMSKEYYLVDMPLEKYKEEYEVRMLCGEVPPPCEIEDITFCSSQMNPATWTFNVVTTPVGATVQWDFGDGSPAVITTAGVPVMHTYGAPGTYNVCVGILSEDGSFCDYECITICMNNIQPPVATAKKQADMSNNRSMQSLKIGDIYPNPAEGTLNIPVDSKENGKVTVRVMRMDGVVVFNREMPVSKGGETLKLDVKNYTPGNYMVEVTNGKAKTTKMIMKK